METFKTKKSYQKPLVAFSQIMTEANMMAASDDPVVAAENTKADIERQGGSEGGGTFNIDSWN